MLFAYDATESVVEGIEHSEVISPANMESNHSSSKKITGIITLEDVIEAVIKDEIIDETDNYIDVNDTQSRVKSRGNARRPNPTNFMKLF